MSKFSYEYITDDTTRAVADKIITQSAKQFLAWRAKSHTRKMKPVGDAFKAWWITDAPTSFKTAEDAAQFKKDVLARATGMLWGHHE